MSDDDADDVTVPGDDELIRELRWAASRATTPEPPVPPVAATSLTLPARPTGICATSCSFRSASAPPLMSVSMKPGATALTVTPVGPSSRASDRANPSSAAFAAEYATAPKSPPPRSAETEDKKTMRPNPRFTMPDTIRRVML